MTWKSDESSRSSSAARAARVIVERHERVVQDERRAASLRDQPDQPDARGQEDLVDRALAQLIGSHPVAAFGAQTRCPASGRRCSTRP